MIHLFPSEDNSCASFKRLGSCTRGFQSKGCSWWFYCRSTERLAVSRLRHKDSQILCWSLEISCFQITGLNLGLSGIWISDQLIVFFSDVKVGKWHSVLAQQNMGWRGTFLHSCALIRRTYPNDDTKGEGFNLNFSSAFSFLVERKAIIFRGRHWGKTTQLPDVAPAG